jgi:hypothetical protein
MISSVLKEDNDAVSPSLPLSPAVAADLPQATLINGQGFYGDCQLNPVVAGAQGNLSLPCNLSTVTVLPDESVQQPWASAANSGAYRVQLEM